MKKQLKILYHLPNPDTIYAGRTIYFGYKHAFEKLNHVFDALTPSDNQSEKLLNFKPDIFISGLGPLTLKFLDRKTLIRAKKNGTIVFINIPFWNSPFSKLRVNETQSISSNKDWITYIKSGEFGDYYFNSCESGDPRMDGFEKVTDYRHHTVLLAADDTLIYPEFSKKFETEISYIGTYLPGKKRFLDEQVLPLIKKYRTKIYGQDWTPLSRLLGLVQRGGQYLNIPYLRSLLKQPLQLEDERRVYASSLISINIHEDYQKKFLGDINERTYKIPLAGGFEIVDNVPSLSKHFKLGEELIVAENKKDWFEKISFYLKNPIARNKIIAKGKAKMLKSHTYSKRVTQILEICRR